MFSRRLRFFPGPLTTDAPNGTALPPDHEVGRLSKANYEQEAEYAYLNLDDNFEFAAGRCRG